MRLSSFPIGARVAIGVALPLIGFAIFLSMFVSAQFAQAERMENVQAVALFNRDVSALVHEIQRERGMSAGYIASQAQGAFVHQLRDQRVRTTAAFGDYTDAISDLQLSTMNSALQDALNHVSEQLATIDSVRGHVDALNTDRSQTVGAYTAMINALIKLVAEETHAAQGGNGTVEIMVGMLNLMHAKESAGLERAVGAAAFSSMRITPALHQRAIALAAEQDAFLTEFRELMGPDWARRLDIALNTPSAQNVTTAPQALIEGGYAGAVSGVSGPQWFEMSSERIENIKSLERDVSEALLVLAGTELQSARVSAFTVMAVGALGLIATLVISTLMILSVVTPIGHITGFLTRMAKGEKDVTISGVCRRDEIGAMSRAAQAFLDAKAEQERINRNAAQREQDAVEARSALLSTMSEDIRRTTDQSMGGMREVSTALRQRTETMRSTLEQAGEEAEAATSATSTTLEQTDLASGLAEELTSAISEVASQIARGDGLARDAISKAARSKDGVESLTEAANQISDFVGVVSGLAEQTNLLALNATIEAARAGEAGKGFAVVASEVKDLAEQTNRSTSEIAERVSRIQDSTRITAASISEVAAAIESLGEVTASVAAAMEEQSASTGSLSTFVTSNRQALRAVADQINSLADAARNSALDAASIDEAVSQMAERTQIANDDIQTIINRSMSVAS